MTDSRSALSIACQRAISGRVRPHPRQSFVFGSMKQTAIQGVSCFMLGTDGHFHRSRKLYKPVPAFMIGLKRGRLLSPLTPSGDLSGWSGGESSRIGASAVITRSGG